MKRRDVPRQAASWLVFLGSVVLLGACGAFPGLPDSHGLPNETPAFPGPFEKYDSARPAAFKRAPDPVASPSPPASGSVGLR